MGIIPGGKDGKNREPGGSGGKSVRRELLDEAVLAVQNDLAMAQPPITVPFCAFNVGSTTPLPPASPPLPCTHTSHFVPPSSHLRPYFVIP